MSVILPEVPLESTPDEAGHFREKILVQANENLAWSFLICAKMLHEIQESKWLEKIGETMPTFLASRSISFGASTASKLVKIYRVLVIDKKIDPSEIASIGDYEKAYILSQIIEEGTIPVDEALAHAKGNSRADLISIKKKEAPGTVSLDKVLLRLNTKLSPTHLALLRGLIKFHLHDQDGTQQALLEFERIRKFSPAKLKMLLGMLQTPMTVKEKVAEMQKEKDAENAETV